MKIYYCKEKNCKNEISKWNHHYGMRFCRSCAHSGERNHFSKDKYIGKDNGNWQGGKPKCLDCGKQLKNFYAKRCSSCAKKYQYATRPETHPMNGKHHTKSSLKKMSKANKKIWSILENRDRIIKACHNGLNIYPNKPEKFLMNLFKQMKLNYKYMGNGKIWINGFNPDFIDLENKKIIELFGDYWHNLPDYKIRDKKKKCIYKKYGYKTLIIWEHELKDLSKLTNKINRF